MLGIPPDDTMLMVSSRWRNAGWSGEEEAAVSAEEKNKALVRRLFEVAGAGVNSDVVDELLAPEFIDHSLLPGQKPDREGYR
jgi:hypothetical protein